MSIDSVLMRTFDRSVSTIGAQTLAAIAMEVMCENNGVVTHSQILARMNHKIVQAKEDNNIDCYASILLALKFLSPYETLMYNLAKKENQEA